MKKLFAVTAFILLFFIPFSFAGLQPGAQVDNNAGTSVMPPYSGPKARIAVADFEVKAAKAGGEIGSGLREMLVTALINSNRFSVLERQVLNAVMQEQALSASGAAETGSGGPQRGKIKTADLIVTAAVTEFEPEASGGGAGFGLGGKVGKGVLGGLLGASLNKAHMALDIRIVDTSSSEVLAATRVQGQATDIAGNVGLGFLGSWGLGAGLSGYANTPMEKAIRVCIIEAIKYISQSIPANYFKY
ncbi:MAG: CsgG/HfaB family protein [Candidatus Omnitrophota bacterium]